MLQCYITLLHYDKVMLCYNIVLQWTNQINSYKHTSQSSSQFIPVDQPTKKAKKAN